MSISRRRRSSWVGTSHDSTPFERHVFVGSLTLVAVGIAALVLVAVVRHWL